MTFLPTNKPQTSQPILTGPSKQSIQRNQSIADTLRKQGSSTSPVGSKTEAISRVLQGALGGVLQGRANKQQAQSDEALTNVLARASEMRKNGADMGEIASILLGNENTRGVGGQLFAKSFEKPKEKERKIIKDANDRQRFADTGDLVFPDVEPIPEAPDPSKPAGQRKEFTNSSKSFVSVRDAYRRVKENGANPSAAGDMGMIFNIMKMFDPGSTVREGEFATAENSGSAPTRISASYNKIISGERLTDIQRQDFLNVANNMFKAQLQGQVDLENQHRGIATRTGLNPENVILDFVGDLRPKTESELPQTTELSDPDEGKTATNPQTGERIIKRNGEWVPIQ